MELQQSCYSCGGSSGIALRSKGSAGAWGGFCGCWEAVPWFDQFSSGRRKRRSSLHPPTAVRRPRLLLVTPGNVRTWDRKRRIQHHDEAKTYHVNITQSRENKPFISVCHQLEDGMVGFASRSCRLPRPRPRAFAGLGSLSLPRISCSLRFSGSFPVVVWILLPTWPRL